MRNLPLAGIQVLIIEEEFLIALDIGLIVEQAGGKSLSFRTFEEARNAKAHWPDYRIAIVNPPDGSISEAEIAREMQDAGIRLVICTADTGTNLAKLGLAVAPIVVKPFTADDLLAACAAALEVN
ncbi:MAG TPA: hypothetical protein VG757_07475 [Devosia sp.]|nr:hypothetical protein [Devosia sp.]